MYLHLSVETLVNLFIIKNKKSKPCFLLFDNYKIQNKISLMNGSLEFLAEQGTKLSSDKFPIKYERKKRVKSNYKSILTFVDWNSCDKKIVSLTYDQIHKGRIFYLFKQS